MIAERGMALSSFFSRPAKRHTLEEGHIISDLRRLADHDPHAMVNEKPGTDLRRGMDFDSRQYTGSLRNETGKKRDAMGLEPMGYAIGHYGVKARVGQHDFEPAGCRRVSVEDRMEICFNGLEHRVYLSSSG